MNEHHRMLGSLTGGLPQPQALVGAWCSANAATPTIFDSDNVTSLTVNSIGNYTITFARALARDGGYAMAGMARIDSSGSSGNLSLLGAPTSTSVTVIALNGNAALANAELLHLIALERTQ